MKKYLYLLGALCGLAACTNDFEEVTPDFKGQENQVHMTVQNFEWDQKQSRTSVNVTESGVEFAWAPDDEVGIFPDAGTQISFAIPTEAKLEGNSATFTGGGWALKKESKYMAYFPFIHDIDLDKTKVPVSFTGQTQQGFATLATSHIGQYDFMAATTQTPAQGAVNFDFKHLGSLVILDITLPMAATYTDVTLTAPEALFVTEGTVDLTATSPAITSTATSATMKITLNNFETKSAEQKVQVYFMAAPVNLAGQNISVKVNSGTSEAVFDGFFTGKDLVAGTAYKFAVELEPKWIDLGLSVFWADHNVGAISVEGYGDYFAWGEIKPKTDYSSYSCTETTDISGNPQYDAATANWGDGARMPTTAEMEALIALTRTWTTQSGVNGYLVNGNGNSIFLPAAGDRRGTSFVGAGKGGSYWSSTPSGDGGNGAYNLYFYSDFFDLNNGWYRSYGYSVRPVRNK